MERLTTLMEDLHKLARGDVNHDAYTIAAPNPEQSPTNFGMGPTSGSGLLLTPNTVTGPDGRTLEVVPFVTESDVRQKLKDFSIDFDQLDTNLACVILSATISRLLERQSYEKIKLAKAESDKLANLARSTNAEVAEPAKAKRAEVLDQISKLLAQQQAAHARCREIVLENRFHYKNKAVELESEFENFATAVQWWYHLSLRVYLERIHQRAASAAEAVNFVRNDEQTQGFLEAAKHGYSSVAGARNKIQIGKTVALSTAEHAVAAYVQDVLAERARVASRAEAGITTESVDNSLVVGGSPKAPEPKEGDKAEGEASGPSSILSSGDGVFQMTMSQYLIGRNMTQADAEAKFSVYADRNQQLIKTVSQAFVTGAHVHCLGRQGNVFYVGETSYGPGVWIGIRLSKPHGEPFPLVYSTAHSIPIRCEFDLPQKTSKCPVENALYAPYQVVSPFVQFEMKELKRSATRVTYANRINRWSLQYLKQIRTSKTTSFDVHCRGPFAVVDSLARATPDQVATSVVTLARYLSSTPVTSTGVRIEKTNPAYLFDDASQIKNTSSLLRARAFYIWMCSHMTCERAAPRNPDELPDVSEVLLQRTGDAEGLALLFRSLCEASGIDCVVIRGVAKGVGGLATVDPVDSRSFKRPNHAWNAFRVAGHRWAIVDVAWSIGTWQGMRPKHVFSPAYFDPPAELAQLTHFPLEVLAGQRQFPELGQLQREPFRAQFSAHPVARYEFQTGPFITRSFIESGLRLIYPSNQYEIEVDQPFVSFALLCPKNIDISVLVQSNGAPNLTLQSALVAPTSSAAGTRLKSATNVVMAANSVGNVSLAEAANRYAWRVSYEPFAASPDTHNVAIVLVSLPTRGTRRISLCVQRRIADVETGNVFGSKAEVAAVFEVKNEIGLYNLRSNTALAVPTEARLKLNAARAFASNNTNVLQSLESAYGSPNGIPTTPTAGSQNSSNSDSYAGFLRNVSGTQEGILYTLVEPMRGYFELGTPLPVQIHCPTNISRLFVVNGSRWVECVRVNTSSATSSSSVGLESEYGLDLYDMDFKDEAQVKAQSKPRHTFESSIILRDTPELSILAFDENTKSLKQIYHFTAPHPVPPTGLTSTGTIVLDPSYRCFQFGLKVHSVMSHGRNTVLTIETAAGVCLHATVHSLWPEPPNRRGGLSAAQKESLAGKSNAATGNAPVSQQLEATARGLGARVKGEVRVTALKANLRQIAHSLPASQTTPATMASLLSPPPATADTSSSGGDLQSSSNASASDAPTPTIVARATQWWQISAEVPSTGQYTLQLFAAHSKSGLYRLVCDCLIYSAVDTPTAV